MLRIAAVPAKFSIVFHKSHESHAPTLDFCNTGTDIVSEVTIEVSAHDSRII